MDAFLKKLKNPFFYLPVAIVLVLTLFGCLFPKPGEAAIYALAGMGMFLLAYFGLALLEGAKLKPLSAKPSKWKKWDSFKTRFCIPEERKKIFRALIAVGLIIIFFIRYYFYGPLYRLGDHLENVNALESAFLAPYEVAISATLNCLICGCVIFVAIKEIRPTPSMTPMVKFAVTPTIFLSLLFQSALYRGIVGNLGTFQYRALLMGLELGLMAAFCAQTWKESPSLKLKREEVYGFVAGMVLFIICDINGYYMKNILGERSTFFSLPLELNMTHRIALYIAFLLPVFYFFLLNPLPLKERRNMMTFMSFAVLIAYVSNGRYEIWTSVTSLPLHMCNTAMFTMPLTLAFNSVGLFYFTMFINVIGALLALLMPNYSATMGVFSTGTVIFYINHWYAFFLPILVVVLGIYKRPKLKYFFYSLIGLLAYYILVCFINIYETPRLALENRDIDFFFINSTFIVDKLGDWAKNVYGTTIVINDGTFEYTIRWFFLLLYFLFYVGFSLALWYVYELLFKGVDAIIAIQEEKQKQRQLACAGGPQKRIGGLFMKKQKADLTRQATLSISHLSKKYAGADVYAVKDFSMELTGGKIYGFLGKNGAGKSTIIKSIVGLHGYDEGTISVCGYDVNQEPTQAKMMIGYVPDNYALYENLTGRQYVGYIADLYEVSQEKRDAILPELLRKLEMEKRFEMPMKTYSHGMKQKITIIAALIHDPKIWILDEPMTGLDPNSIFQIKELMREHAAKGNIVFFSSHIIDVVQNLCSEVLIIRKGEFIERDDLADLKQRGIDLEELFLRLTGDDPEQNRAILEDERK